MFGSSFGDLAFRRVWNHRTSLSDEFDVPQEYVVFAFDVLIRRAALSFSFQVHGLYHLKMLVKVGLIAFSNACFEVEDEGPEKSQHGSLADLPNIFASHLYGLSKVAVVGFCA